MTPAQAASEILKFDRQLTSGLLKAEHKTLAQMRKNAVQLSSGPFTGGQLRAMGHPYATRDPRPPGDPASVNIKTGTFRDSWKAIEGTWVSNDFLFNQLRNDDPVADWLLNGTARMIARPIQRRIEDGIQAVRVTNILEAIRKAQT